MEITSAIKEDFVVIDEEATVSQMIGALKQFEKRSGLVFKNKKYLGLIEKKRLLRSRIDATEAKVKHFLQKTPILNEHADVIETSYLMYQGNLDFLPVESNKSIIGVLSAIDIAKLGTDLPEAKGWKVDDLKLLKPAKLNVNDPIAEVIDLMYQEKIEQVPLFREGKMDGLVSYRDILRRYLNWSPKRDVSTKFNKMASSRSAEVDMPHLASLPASDFSTTMPLVTVTHNTKVKDAINLMLQHNVSCLPVMEDQEYVGLLTEKNILRKIASMKIRKNFNLSFIGLNQMDIEPYQKYNIKKICSNESFKLQRGIHNDFSMTIHLKEYGKEGQRHKFSIHMRLEYPGKLITSSQDDWDIETALRKAFNNAKNEVSNRLRSDRKREKNFEF
ncbi:CBS domain-containing protein [Candidatus Woesearchaeota archaeon]|nr:CBS domain-containing protein [Candidatus Woesearchaeota archaeon]